MQRHDCIQSSFGFNDVKILVQIQTFAMMMMMTMLSPHSSEAASCGFWLVVQKLNRPFWK